MGKNSAIEWTDHTFNPWVGCTKVSPACDHCYAESWAKRTGHPELWQGERRRTSEANWRLPIRWNSRPKAGVRERIFCASLADVFDNQVPEQWRSDLWELIASTPHLDWLLLTKRPQNIMKMLPRSCAVQIAGQDWPWPNVWLGTTAENQEEADRRIPELQKIPALIYFLSIEPLLGPIDLRGWLDMTRIDWVIVGGESGPHARPMHPDWARSIRDQCNAAGVPFFFKQWGEWHWLGQYAKGTPLGDDGPTAKIMVPSTFPEGVPDNPVCMSRRGGKKRAGRLLDGREWNEIPERWER